MLLTPHPLRYPQFPNWPLNFEQYLFSNDEVEFTKIFGLAITSMIDDKLFDDSEKFPELVGSNHATSPYFVFVIKLIFLFVGSVLLISLIQQVLRSSTCLPTPPTHSITFVLFCFPHPHRAVMTKEFEDSQERGLVECKSVLEQARILRLIETGMSDAERLQPDNRYFEEREDGKVVLAFEREEADEGPLGLMRDIHSTRTVVRNGLNHLLELLNGENSRSLSAGSRPSRSGSSASLRHLLPDGRVDDDAEAVDANAGVGAGAGMGLHLPAPFTPRDGHGGRPRASSRSATPAAAANPNPPPSSSPRRRGGR